MDRCEEESTRGWNALTTPLFFLLSLPTPEPQISGGGGEEIPTAKAPISSNCRTFQHHGVVKIVGLAYSRPQQNSDHGTHTTTANVRKPSRTYRCIMSSGAPKAEARGLGVHDPGSTTAVCVRAWCPMCEASAVALSTPRGRLRGAPFAPCCQRCHNVTISGLFSPTPQPTLPPLYFFCLFHCWRGHTHRSTKTARG